MLKLLKALSNIRLQALAATAIISVVLAILVSPYIPRESVHAQSVGPGGVPGRGDAGAVSSVFGRTGAVTAQSGDYTAAQVTNAADKNSSSTQAFAGNVAAPVVNATSGFQANGGATAGNYLRGNGTSFVSSAIQASDLPAGTPQTVATATVPGANASVVGFSVYTATTSGIYRICGSYVVTSAGSTGATLEGYTSFYNGGVGHEPVLGGAAEAATAAGASGAGYGQNNCVTALVDANTPIGMGYIVGGSPATNPTYTYWYAVTRL